MYFIICKLLICCQIESVSKGMTLHEIPFPVSGLFKTHLQLTTGKSYIGFFLSKKFDFDRCEPYIHHFENWGLLIEAVFLPTIISILSITSFSRVCHEKNHQSPRSTENQSKKTLQKPAVSSTGNLLLVLNGNPVRLLKNGLQITRNSQQIIMMGRNNKTVLRIK